MAYYTLPSIDRNRYTDLSHEGLEGPYVFESGKVLYYDRKEGLYYDRDTDFYVSNSDMLLHYGLVDNHYNPKKEI